MILFGRSTKKMACSEFFMASLSLLEALESLNLVVKRMSLLQIRNKLLLQTQTCAFPMSIWSKKLCHDIFMTAQKGWDSLVPLDLVSKLKCKTCIINPIR